MIIPAPNDIAFNIGAISIYYYGIIMAGAIFVALIAANFLFNKTYPQYKKDIVLESAPIIIILGILGARLYFLCLNPHYYFTRPLEILDIREVRIINSRRNYRRNIKHFMDYEKIQNRIFQTD